MEDIIELIITAIPWLEGFVDQAFVVVTAIPAWGLPTSTFLILAVGSLYILRKHGYLKGIGIEGGEWNDTNW